ncbi:MAG: hypothetical protein ACOQNV_00475 [Mycoplasmoidaceae bacterium]
MEKTINNKDNPWIISYGRTDYDGRPIKTLQPIHTAQQIHKYKLGLFVGGIIGLIIAIIDFAMIVTFMAKGQPIDDYGKALSKAITSFTIMFVVMLLIDVIFTINLNRYERNKRWLILYIPCLAAMLLFSVPQIMTLIKLMVPSINIPEIQSWKWANYINIVVCIIFIIAEAIRLYLHRKEVNLKQEVYEALK